MSHPHHPTHALHPAMRQLMDRIHRAGHPPMQAMTPAQARAFYEAGAPLLDIAPPHIQQVRDLVLDMPLGVKLPARMYRDGGEDPAPVLV